tara:strand:+ start:2495 stop:3634 length:1140 start_codon:yes stop_codon:yes gene_type:complete
MGLTKKKLNIVLIEPFYSGSHKSWAEQYKKYSFHNIEILKLNGIYWKWRMHGGAITLAKMFNKYLEKNKKPDLLIISDMLNLTVFYSFIKLNNLPIITFFHENQLTYPWSTQDRDKEKNRDHHYGFINYTTALKSNLVMFNSNFHKTSFIIALRKFLKQFPDHRDMENVDSIYNKSIVSYLGLNLKIFDKYKIKKKNKVPIILWNHRWEYDKNPVDFFKCLNYIKNKNINFKLIILGEQFEQEMSIFSEAKIKFKKEIIHIGYCKKFEDYAKLLWISDIIPITTKQDFFGISIMEALYCNVIPILPNRLSYPELYDNKNNFNNFYNDLNELKYKLEQLLKNVNHLSENNKFRKIASQYDWSKIKDPYDLIMLNVYNNYY